MLDATACLDSGYLLADQSYCQIEVAELGNDAKNVQHPGFRHVCCTILLTQVWC